MSLDEFLNSPIVIDNGSGLMKVGYSGEEKPIVFSTLVGRPKYKVVIPSPNQSDIVVGEPLNTERRGLLKLKYPMTHGIIQNWDDMELLWKHSYELLKASPKEYPVLLTEPNLNPLSHKLKLIDIFFNKYNVPALFVAVQGVLSLYGSGNTTGVVLDSGDGVTHVVPVYEGYSLPHACERIDLGGRDVTQHLMHLLRKNGASFHTSAEFQLVRKLKETKCSISSYAVERDEEKKMKEIKDKYVLPDGSNLQLSTERTLAGQILFSPERIGLDYPSLSQLMLNSLAKVDIDLRKSLYHNIVLSGGNTMFEGLPDRFLNDLKKSAGKEVKIRLLAPTKRNIMCWSGGSILSKLTYFKNMWITKQEYEDEGNRIIMRKAL